MSKLINKAHKSYSYVSRYTPFPYYYHTEDDKYVYGITAQLDDSTPYTLHTVSQGDTLDNLALYYYNNPTLYWVICAFNRLNNPYMRLQPGDKLKIPALSNIKFDINGRS